MKTLIIDKTDEKSLWKAGKIIRKGGIVAFPTETVYGLGANAYDENAIKKIYKAKGRPSDNPLIVHIAEIGDLEKVAREIPENARKLVAKFAPGPFTLILKKQPDIPDVVTAGLDTVGVRIPKDATARAFIRLAGVPIAAPSANISGKPSPTKAEHVIADLDGKVDAIICGEDAEIGVESTIIDVTGEIPTILRPGGITKEDIISVCGRVEISQNVLTGVKKNETPKCPGMKYKHYSPDAEITVVEGEKKETADKIKELIKADREKGIKVGVLASSENEFNADLYIFEGKNNREFANVLFDALREFDKNGIEKAYVQMCMKDEMELTVKNRIYKSAGYRIIDLGE
ncbi:MAG: threonylcarbamoyl-AMP synthase [Clostridia bacterium]|nr:threonylcarbamoyl-AMP synthase [Clostridia bacterium]